jgi:hypothetical protein
MKERLAVIAGTQLVLIADAAIEDLLTKDHRDTLKIVIDIIKLGAFSLDKYISDIEELSPEQKKILEGMSVSFPDSETEE